MRGVVETWRKSKTGAATKVATKIGIVGLGIVSAFGGSLEKEFLKPPDEARPWVYAFFVNGNMTSNGITADLEAMKRAGIGGMLVFEVDQGAPRGKVEFGSNEFRGLFQHLCKEAKRLGLKVSVNNDAGWCGSGGPWITPELSMQKAILFSLA